MKQKRILRPTAAALAALLISCPLCGCTNPHSDENGGNDKADSPTISGDYMAASEIAQTTLDPDDTDTSWNSDAPVITLSGGSADCSAQGVSIAGGSVTIHQGGTYIIRGTLDDGQLLIDGDAKFHLIFDGAAITSTTSAPLNIKNAKKVVITLADGSSNQLTDAAAYTSFTDAAQTEPNAALFAKSDLTINGTGNLTVRGNYANGIHSKDSLCIVNGNVSVEAKKDGIKGKDAVMIKDGTISVTAGEDGIRSDNTTDPTCGYISVENGTLTIEATQDGFQSETCTAISGGTIQIRAGGGTENAQTQGKDDFGGGRGFTHWDSDQSAESDDTAVSAKAIKAGTELLVRGGEISADSAEDTLHANRTVTLEGGTTALAAGDDGIHADSLLTISGGTHTITQSYEGLEAEVIQISDGTISVTASDDGINATDGSDTSAGMGGFGAASATAKFELSGGHLAVYAGGDGLDSNGTLTITGGTALVHGPTNSGNGALDSGAAITVNGGMLIAAGSAGMAEQPSNNSSQKSVSLGLGTQNGGTLVCITDSKGEAVLAFAPQKQFQSLIFSTDALIENETYTVCTGGTYTGGTETDGLYTGGSYSGGTEFTTFTISGTVTTAGNATGGMGGFGNPGGFGGGQRPDRGDTPQGMIPPDGAMPPNGMMPFGETPTDNTTSES
ncbi:MAG: carbohydrate-binding domain-containing protein [Ruminococcus sp.]|nr:carbohydrate-binding domain-containing protein [Ruminococcus sp.]